MATVSVSSPTNGSTVGSSVHFVASATSGYTVTAMAIYADNNLAYKASGSSLDTYVTLAAGAHYIVVQSWDATGAVQKSAENITVSASAPAPAPAPTSGSAVSVSSPASGAAVGSPVHFVASASAANPISAMMIYVDNSSVYTTKTATVDTYLTLGSGNHYVVTQAWDTSGAVYKDARSISVSGTTSAPAPAPAPTVGTAISNIDQMTGWQNCTVCAGAGGNGSVASFSMTQFV